MRMTEEQLVSEIEAGQREDSTLVWTTTVQKIEKVGGFNGTGPAFEIVGDEGCVLLVCLRWPDDVEPVAGDDVELWPTDYLTGSSARRVWYFNVRGAPSHWEMAEEKYRQGIRRQALKEAAAVCEQNIEEWLGSICHDECNAYCHRTEAAALTSAIRSLIEELEPHCMCGGTGAIDGGDGEMVACPSCGAGGSPS